MGITDRDLEKKFEAECIKKLRRLPNSFWPEKVESKMIRGLNDRTGCVNGRFIALEFKRGRDDMGAPRTKLQEYVLDMIEDAGGYAAFCYPENWLLIYDDIRKMSRSRDGQ